MTIAESTTITGEQLLEHWQGHRRLTRRVIEAFPEDKLFSLSIGGMRPFSELAMETANMAEVGINGIVTRKWENVTAFDKVKVDTKAKLLEYWDYVTTHIDKNWKNIPEGRFQEHDNAFGQYEGPIYWHLFYFFDNEIHHRGQGYVYLRSLNIEPPFFWER